MALAYLLNAVQKDGLFIKASTDDQPSIIEIDSQTFEKLVDSGVARKPTENEVKFFKALQIEDAEVVEDDQSEPVAPKKSGGRTKAHTPAADSDLTL